LNGVSIEYVNQALEELIGAFGIKAPVLSDPIFEALEAGNTQKCLTIISRYLGLPVVIDLSTVELAEGSQSNRTGEKFESTAIVVAARPGQAAQSITAQILIPNRMPIYGSSELENFHLRVKVSDNCLKYPKTFAAVMAHEFSHIVLHSIKHTQKDNEFYTDLTAMILGFSEILRKGRKTVEIKESSSKTQTTTTTTTTTYGYLSDDLFTFAFDKIKNTFLELRKTDRALQDKILNKIVSFNTIVTNYEEKRVLLSKLLVDFDKNPKKIEKDDALKIVRMHQMYYLEGLADIGKHHLRKLAEISEASTKNLVVTSLCSKQRLNQLRVLLQKAENSLSQLEKDCTSLESDISIFERNAGFFAKHRIKH
jgi:hypothetical protein